MATQYLGHAEGQVGPLPRVGGGLEAQAPLVDERVALLLLPDVGQQVAHDGLEGPRWQAWLARQRRQDVGQQVVDGVGALRRRVRLGFRVSADRMLGSRL